MLMTMYATGARRAEAARLKVGDIDNKRMAVHIRDGKGGKHRDVLLRAFYVEAVGPDALERRVSRRTCAATSLSTTSIGSGNTGFPGDQNSTSPA